MERFIKKFFDCFEEEMKQIIINIKLELESCNTNIMRAECTLSKIQKDNFSYDEYKRQYNKNKENDIKYFEKM